MRTHSARRSFTHLASALALAFAALPAAGQAVFFTIDNSNATTGSMSLSSGSLGNAQLNNPSALTTGANAFNYATVYFVPTLTRTYTFGQTSAPVDTVMILYDGVFDATAPGAGAVAGNDDTSQANHRTAVGDPAQVVSCGGSPGLCPQVSSAVTAGNRYTLLVSTFSTGSVLNLPLEFYSDGAGNFFAAPPPAAAGVLAATRAMTNSPAYGAAQVIDDTPALQALFSGVSGDAQVSEAAAQTLPLMVGGTTTAIQGTLNGVNRLIQARMSANRGLSSGETFAGDRNIWMKPFGAWADQNSRNGVAGYKADTYGVLAGIDGALSQALRIGAAFAYARTDIDGGTRVAPQGANIDTYTLIAYGSYSLDDRTEVNLQADVGLNRNDGRRTIALTNTTARADYDTHTAHIGGGIGHVLSLSEKTALTPSVRMDYTWIRDQSYSESGAGLLDLNVNSRTTELLVFAVESKLSHSVNDQSTLLANLGVGYDVFNERAALTSSFAGAPGALFVTRGIDASAWLLRGGLGVAHMTRSGLEVTGRYDVELRDTFVIQSASVKLNWLF